MTVGVKKRKDGKVEIHGYGVVMVLTKEQVRTLVDVLAAAVR